MEFKQLRSFVTVADCGSFTQAAVRLYTSQPTVSAHIRQLEDELHETLFLRTTKRLTITARGRELYDYAVHVLELQDQLLDAWAQDEHTIRLGASTIPSAYILPEVLPSFRAQHPDAVFSVLQSDSAGVLRQLRAGRFEQSIKNLVAAGLGVSITPARRRRTTARPVGSLPSRFRQTARGGACISSGAKTARCGSRHWGSSNLSEIFIQSSRTETESKARRIFLRAFDLCLGGDYAAIAPIRASSCALLQALSGWKLLPETAPICFAQSAGCA